MRSIVLPYTRTSVVGGIMLGSWPRLGRDDGRHLRDRQYQPPLAPRCSPPATPLPRWWRSSSRKPAAGSLKLSSLLALGLHPVRHLVHRAGDIAAAAAPACEGLIGNEHQHRFHSGVPACADHDKVGNASLGPPPPHFRPHRGRALRGRDHHRPAAPRLHPDDARCMRGVAGLSLRRAVQEHRPRRVAMAAWPTPSSALCCKPPSARRSAPPSA